MPYKKRNPFAAFWLNDRIKGLSVAEIFGTLCLVLVPVLIYAATR